MGFFEIGESRRRPSSKLFSGSGVLVGGGRTEKKCENFRGDAFRCQPKLKSIYWQFLLRVRRRSVWQNRQSGFLDASDESGIARIIRQENRNGGFEIKLS